MSTAPGATERFLTANQAADLLGICRASVYRLVANGSIPPGVRFGKIRRWPQSEILNAAKPIELPHTGET